MFVRAAWQRPRQTEYRQNLREIEVPARRDADPIGMAGPDFSRMTHGLFDR